MYLHGKERLLSILWVLRIEAGEHLQVRRATVVSVERTCGRGSVQLVDESEHNDVPLLRSIFTPGGKVSIPALIASKASSSGIGTGRHLVNYHVGVVHKQELSMCSRHHHETVLCE